MEALGPGVHTKFDINVNFHVVAIFHVSLFFFIVTLGYINFEFWFYFYVTIIFRKCVLQVFQRKVVIDILQ